MLGAIQVLPISVLQVGEGPIVSNSEYRHPKWQMSKHIDNQWEGIYSIKEREGMLIMHRLKYAYYLPKHTLQIFFETKRKNQVSFVNNKELKGIFQHKFFRHQMNQYS